MGSLFLTKNRAIRKGNKHFCNISSLFNTKNQGKPQKSFICIKIPKKKQRVLDWE
jgi:hypothetical protein